MQPTESATGHHTETGTAKAGQATRPAPQSMAASGRERRRGTQMSGKPQTSGQSQMQGGAQMRGQPQTSGQSQMQGGTQMHGRSQPTGQGQTGQQFQQRLPQQTRTTLTAIAEAIEVCEWCADQCVQAANPDMIECIRLCEDVSELGEATLALTSRQSRYGQSVAQAFLQAVQACMQECGRHEAAHCQECAQTLQRTARECEQLLQSAGAQSTR